MISDVPLLMMMNVTIHLHRLNKNFNTNACYNHKNYRNASDVIFLQLGDGGIIITQRARGVERAQTMCTNHKFDDIVLFG